MFDYEKGRPTLSHFTKGEIAHSPESMSFIWCVPIQWCVFNFALQCAVNAWQCAANAQLCVLNEWYVSFENMACVPNENTSPFCEHG